MVCNLEDCSEYSLSAKTSRISRPASFYVRLRVPKELLQDTNSPVQLTTARLKFGITYDVNNRDYGYVNVEPDNGYMAYSFECETRAEASAVERIVRAQFEDVAVLNSFEYLDVAGVAEWLGHEYEAYTYENYVAVGRKLFVHMVETAKIVFPRKYLGRYGVEYQATTKVSSRKLTGSFEAISDTVAMDYGFRTPSIAWTKLSAEHREPLSTMRPSQYMVARKEVTRKDAWKDIPFEDVPVFVNMVGGEAIYQKVACNMKRASEVEKAGKALHDYAIKMWRIPLENIDECFYVNHVKAADASSTFHKARRFVAAMDSTLDAKTTTVAECCQPHELFDGDRTVYAMKLVVGQTFLNSIADATSLAALRSLQKISVEEDACMSAYKNIVDGLSPEEKPKFTRIFDFKGTTGCMAAKKILGDCFGMDATRRDPKSDRRHYHTIVLSHPTPKIMAEKYGTDLCRTLVDPLS